MRTARYGFTLPMDKARASASIDLSGRPYFRYEGSFTRSHVGGFPTEMVEHFWRSFADAMRCTLHLSVTGENTHHQIEVGFKAVARNGNWGDVAKGVTHKGTYGTAWGGYILIEVDDPEAFGRYQAFHLQNYAHVVNITFEPAWDMDSAFAETVNSLR